MKSKKTVLDKKKLQFSRFERSRYKYELVFIWYNLNKDVTTFLFAFSPKTEIQISNAA